MAAGVIIGNVALQAASVSRPARWPGEWRQLNQIGRLPFQTFTLKVADEPGGLSTALAMYYIPGRKVHVIGRGVAIEQLPFENVSRQQPMFIQNFGCEGVGTWRYGFRTRRGMLVDGAAEYDCRDCLIRSTGRFFSWISIG